MIIIFILISIFLLYSFFYLLKKYLKNKKVSELEEKNNFEITNEYLKNFIPFFENDKNKFFFISGPAGSGKSKFIEDFNKYLNYKNIKTQITSSTGISAIGLSEAMTIHSYSGINDKEGVENLSKVLLNNKHHDNIKKLEVLIIDEISMISLKQFDLLNLVFQKIRSNNDFFGGLKLLLIGDLLQLPPFNKDKNGADNFIFKSENWEKMNFLYFTLNSHFRQKDKTFIKYIDALRLGETLPNVSKYFNGLKNDIASNEDNLNLSYSKKLVLKKNNEILNQNKNKAFVFYPEIWGRKKLDYKQEIDEKIKKFGDILIIKKNCRVMHLINDNEQKLVNGSVGTVSFVNKDKIIVNWDNGENKELNKHTFKDNDEWDISDDELSYGFRVFPIILAHSITVHKSQGMSLDYYKINFQDNCFKFPGATYVALSRAKDPKKIYIENFSVDKIKANKKALDFYLSKIQKFYNLSVGDVDNFDVELSEVIRRKHFEWTNNHLWEDEEWVIKNLIKKNIINKEHFNYYKKVAGVYKIEVLVKIQGEIKKKVYIGQSANLMQRLCHHINNALEITGKIKKKQQISKTIKKYGLENVRYTILTSKEWFIGKYISEEDWNQKSERNKRKAERKFLLFEEKKEIKNVRNLKEKNEYDSVENRTDY